MLGTRKLSVMISSTAVDLPEHRQQAREACLCEDVFPEAMESLPASDAAAIQVSLEMVDKAHIYIGIFACRYGHIPKRHQISITEMEFNRAVQRGIPVLVFIAHKDHPFTIGQVETNEAAQKKLKRLKERACKGRTRCEFKSPAELRAQIIHALAALKQRELRITSLPSAILAEKERLEKLDPRFSVDIKATAQSMHFHVQPLAPLPALPLLKLLGKSGTDEMRAFSEKGQPLELKVSDVPAEDWPIVSTLLREWGCDKVMMTTAAEFTGCIQIVFQSPRKEWKQIQVDGKWSLAPKRAAFKGQVSDSPLEVECVRDGDWTEKPQPSVVKCRFDWNAWEGQPLLRLAYFSELSEFIRCAEFTARSYIRGNQPWQPEAVRVLDPFREKLVEAFDWLLRSRRAAVYLGVNPPFPRGETINAKQAEAENVALMMKLIESGFHEQTIAGQTFAVAGDSTSDPLPVGTEGLSGKLTEPYRDINFFGIHVPFGPLIHTWTGAQLIAVRPMGNNRQELEFRGSGNSLWRIEYGRPTPPAPSSPPPTAPGQPRP